MFEDYFLSIDQKDQEMIFIHIYALLINNKNF